MNTQNMTLAETLTRYDAVLDALQVGADKPERWYAFLLPRRRPGAGYIAITATSLLGIEGDPEGLAQALFDRHAALNDLVKGYSAPRNWVDGALTVRFGVDPGRYAKLIENRRFSRDAAMALTLLSHERALPSEQTESIFKAIKPFLLNSVNGLEGALWTYSAAHALRGERAETVRTLLARARSVFESHRQAKSAAKLGAYVSAGLNLEPGAVLKRFVPLYEQRKQNSALKRFSRDQLLVLAALGVGIEHASEFAQCAEAVQRSPGLNKASRAMLSWLLWIQFKGEASGLSVDQIRLAFIACTLSTSVAVTAMSQGGGGGDGGGDGGGE